MASVGFFEFTHHLAVAAGMPVTTLSLSDTVAVFTLQTMRNRFVRRTLKELRLFLYQFTIPYLFHSVVFLHINRNVSLTADNAVNPGAFGHISLAGQQILITENNPFRMWDRIILRKRTERFHTDIGVIPF